jgi:hypothetical protein
MIGVNLRFKIENFAVIMNTNINCINKISNKKVKKIYICILYNQIW